MATKHAIWLSDRHWAELEALREKLGARTRTEVVRALINDAKRVVA